MPHVTAPAGCHLVALDHRLVEAGETVEVDDDTARSLVEQGWREATPDDRPARRARTENKAAESAKTEE